LTSSPAKPHLFSSQKIHVAFHDTPHEISNGHILIRVVDTGPGLSLEQQRALFSEGVQFNPNELQAGQGSGLGLWISKEIVLLHGGQIRVTSRGLGCGATFEVILPVYLRENLQPDSIRSPRALHLLPFAPVEKSNPQSDPPTNILPIAPVNDLPMHLLVVDDASSNRKLVARILRSKGYLCDEAEDGQECVSKVMSGTHHYDAILMDYEMPILNGPLAAKKLREMKFDFPIIGLTGNVLPEDKEYYRQQGANLILTKPLDVEKLIDYLDSYRKNSCDSHSLA
jgi:CheY-like chemotaxis protein